MKLRIFQDTLRLRLGQGEVATVAAGGTIGHQIRFHTAALGYRLSARDQPAVTADFSGILIDVVVPLTLTREWADSDRVGIDQTISVPGGSPLRLLIEKDFECLDAPQDNPPDPYRNPARLCPPAVA